MVCKHIVATILYATQEDLGTSSPEPVNINEYLNSLSKQELVELLMKYASDELLTIASNKTSRDSDTQKILKKATRQIQALFDDEVLRNQPDEFDARLNKVLGSLSGLEEKIPQQLKALVIDIIDKVYKATDDGYLYDHYRDYHYQPSVEFFGFIASIVKAMDFNQKIAFIEELDEKICSTSYYAFEYTYKCLVDFFSGNEVQQLRTFLVSEYKNMSIPLMESYYTLVSAIVSSDEKEILLTVLAGHNDSLAVELGMHLELQGKRLESIEMLRKLISRGDGAISDRRVCLLYLDQIKTQGVIADNDVVICLKKYSDEVVLRKAVEVAPQHGAAFESLLENRNSEQLLNYLESENRDQDALSLVKRSRSISDDRKFTFYKKNKEKFSDDARRFFKAAVSKNLQNTGDHYYRAIADSLKQLKQIDKASADELVLYLHQYYKRRSNLMLMIAEI